MSQSNTELLLNEFAYQSFRDMADEDYVTARMAHRASFATQFAWCSQQAVEKYLKCILLLNRIPARKPSHRLVKALNKIERSGRVSLELSQVSREFVEGLDPGGTFRYMEISNHIQGRDLLKLDRTVWELRRYCTLDRTKHQAQATAGKVPTRVVLPGGTLERIMDGENQRAREPLLWRNGFFGKRGRLHVRFQDGFSARNAMLYLYPDILDEVCKYVFVPKEVVHAYREHAKASGDGKGR